MNISIVINRFAVASGDISIIKKPREKNNLDAAGHWLTHGSSASEITNPIEFKLTLLT